MKNVLLVMSSNRDIEKETQRCVLELRRRGAGSIIEQGSPDVAFARNRALTSACGVLREYPERDVVLMLDDDMVVSPDVAAEVVGQALELGAATSAMYATASARLAGCRWKEHADRWLVGLGCVAIPAALLLELEERSESFDVNGAIYSAFTWCGPEHGRWIAEDYRLSIRLGGVVLLPIAVGHIKKGTIWPDDVTIDRVRNGVALGEDEPARAAE